MAWPGSFVGLLIVRPSMLRVVEWVETRTGLVRSCKGFLLEEIPGSAGWAQVFGSVTLFVFLVQALTGILLALNFAPTPTEAYQSLRYITYQVFAGRLVHGLHHWGATAMVIAAFVHMTQVFLYGAYKKPREATWMIGVALLLLILAFGLTGYLLPWDNRAYWGTVVTTRIMASAPVMGRLLSRISGAGDGIGAVTYARFYAMHTILLPAATVSLVFAHVYLVRRHGVAPATEVVATAQRFYPKQMFRDLVAIFVSFSLLFAAAAFLEVPMERVADPSDTSYTPRPEWYFLFLFEALKLFSGALEWIGTFALPSIAVALLLGVPFLPARLRLNKKLPAVASVTLVASLWGTLTLAAIQGSPRRMVSVPQEALEWAQIAPEETAGMGYFRSLGCGSCHNLITGFPKTGPNLAASELHHPKQWLAQHFRHPAPENTGRPLPLTELNALALFIANLKPGSMGVMQRMSSQFVRGAQVYVIGACNTCHKVNGAGGGIGPPLNGLAERRSKEWTEAHFLSPAKLSPGSVMPPYQFSREDEDAILLYLFSLSN